MHFLRNLYEISIGVKRVIVLVSILLGIFLSIGLCSLMRINVPFVAFRPKMWSIRIYEGRNPFVFASAEMEKSVPLTAADITDVPAEYVADPFMIKKDSVWYIFFEVMHAIERQGDIALATSKDGSSI